MKSVIRKILILLVAGTFIVSCSSDDKNPPLAGFSISFDDDIIQWDVVNVINAAFLADEVSYTVSGGEYVWEKEFTELRLLEATTYTITQTATNSDGTDTASLTIEAFEPENTYNIDQSNLPITSNPFWWDGTSQGGTVYIRFLADVSTQDNPNLLKLYPVSGSNPIQGTYPYESTGDVGTYDAGVTANYAGFVYDWTTNGDGGADLVIDLVYEDPNNADDNIYNISLPSYTLNYGNWNFASFTWESMGTKTFSLTYRGKIDPLN